MATSSSPCATKRATRPRPADTSAPTRANTIASSHRERGECRRRRKRRGDDLGHGFALLVARAQVAGQQAADVVDVLQPHRLVEAVRGGDVGAHLGGDLEGAAQERVDGVSGHQLEGDERQCRGREHHQHDVDRTRPGEPDRDGGTTRTRRLSRTWCERLRRWRCGDQCVCHCPGLSSVPITRAGPQCPPA